MVGASMLFIPWVIFFVVRPDVRREMLVMSFLLGVLSVVTAQYWWTVDWWKPETITGTIVGIEDFLIGFASGGIMTVAYEVLFRKRLYKSVSSVRAPGPFTLLLLLAFITSWLFWAAHLTSFWGSTLAMAAVASVLFYFRKDLFLNAVLSGILMAGISLLFYFTVMSLSPEWIPKTYQFETLSGILVLGVPAEEFVFWFLAGLVFGPFYEYWQGKRTRNIST